MHATAASICKSLAPIPSMMNFPSSLNAFQQAGLTKSQFNSKSTLNSLANYATQPATTPSKRHYFNCTHNRDKTFDGTKYCVNCGSNISQVTNNRIEPIF